MVHCVIYTACVYILGEIRTIKWFYTAMSWMRCKFLYIYIYIGLIYNIYTYMLLTGKLSVNNVYPPYRRVYLFDTAWTLIIIVIVLYMFCFDCFQMETKGLNCLSLTRVRCCTRLCCLDNYCTTLSPTGKM